MNHKKELLRSLQVRAFVFMFLLSSYPHAQASRGTRDQ